MATILNLSEINSELRAPVTEFCRMQGIRVSKKGTVLKVRRGQSRKIVSDGGICRITYVKKSDIFRLLSMLPSLDGKTYVETGKGPEMLCYMVDESRNAVLTVESAKKLVMTLASLGYDSMMLYTEDTFELPGYPYFGHMRGRWTREQLRELDAFAASFGIEMIPCVQTLAHLTTAIRWPGLSSFSDTGDILLAGDERTYKFVRDVLNVCAECFKSRRINIGMDEAHSLGLGRYLRKNGYHPAPEIMLSHLERVAAICREEGFAPMMWSDMFFRMAFDGTYRVREGEISQEIIDKVPENVGLIYWDYYSLDRQIFDHMVDSHLKFNNEVLFAGGAWKWDGFAPSNRFSLVSTKLQLDSCTERNLGKIIFTGWGDNGGEASQFSILPVLLYFSEYLYRGSDPDVAVLRKRSKDAFGAKWDDLLKLDLPNALPGTAPGEIAHPVDPCKYLLYNDPLEGLLDRHMNDDVAERYKEYAEKLFACAGNRRWGYLFKTLATLCDLLSVKADLGRRIRAAYLAGDRDTVR
ncbi:MAG: family 20 glycosylhydrolase, partial [Clostridia bacterium]|nr:family 20 glycosylhydrolase [Clostridia bacterium]